MKVSIGIDGAASGRGRGIEDDVAYELEAEKLGVDTLGRAMDLC